MKKLLIISTLATSLTLTACNSGGSTTSAANNSANNTNNATESIPKTTPAKNGSSTANVVTITVDGGPTGQSPNNTPFVSVTVCNVNNPSNCQTIDHIILDTGSMGLRLFANQLKSGLNLTNQTINGQKTAECTLFGSGYDWGSVALANVQLGGETATNIPIQIINDPTIPAIPTDCSNQGAYNDLGGAKGIIGVNPLPYDNGSYYTCSGTSCSANNNVATAQQIVSPVYKFSSDNNGVIVSLPSVPSGGTTSLSGTLTFGIGTQSNNQLTAQNIFTSNGTEQDGSFTTTYSNGSYDSIFDTGSTELFFDTPSNQPALTVCTDNSGFYCPNSTTSISTQLSSLGGGNSINFDFSIINFDNYIQANPNSVAIPNAGATGGQNFFIWGLPFFYGRTVFSAFSQASTPGGNGPYFAF